MAKTEKKTKHISHLIRIIVAVGALYFAFRGESISKITDMFKDLNAWIFLAAAVLFFLAQFVFVARWLLILRAQSIAIRFMPAFRLHLLGLFYNNCLPGSVGGDVLRAWYVAGHTDKKIEAAISVFVDRAIGLSCTIATVFIAYWFLPGGRANLQLSAEFNLVSLAVKFFIALGSFILLLIIVLFVMYKVRRFRGYLMKYAFFFFLKYKFWLSRITGAVKLYCCKPFTIAFAVILSFACQAMAIIGLYFIGRNLGIESPVKYYFVFFPLSWIIGIVPISVGGAGVMELGLKGLFSKVAEVTASQGLVLALSQRFVWLITAIPGVFIHILGKHLPQP